MACLVAGGSIRGAARGWDLIVSLEEIHSSKASIRRCGGRLLYPGGAAYLLGRGRHHRFPPPPQRHRLDLLRRGPGNGPQRPRARLRQVLARRRFRHKEPRRNGGVVRFVVVDPPGLPPNKLHAAAVPGREASLAPLEARGLVRGARDHRLRRGRRDGGRAARRLPPDRKPLRHRKPCFGGSGKRSRHRDRGLHGAVGRLAHRSDAARRERAAPADQMARLRRRGGGRRHLRSRRYIYLERVESVLRSSASPCSGCRSSRASRS